MRKEINKNNIDEYLRILGKELRKINKSKYPIELIIVGGASIIINYDFRNMSFYIDAFNNAQSMVKEAARNVANRCGLSVDWINDDFKKTRSFSMKLRQYSEHYRTFSNCLDVRTVKREYLLAMKIVSSRRYKKDQSDVFGILNYHYEHGDEISLDEIERAVKELYEDIDITNNEVYNLIKESIKNHTYNEIYISVKNKEIAIKEGLIDFQEKNPSKITSDNLDEIIENELSL